MNAEKTFLVDNDSVALNNRYNLLTDFGYSCYIFTDVLSALNALGIIKPRIFILKLNQKDENLWGYLQKIQKANKNIRIIIISEINSVEFAVETMKNGVFDYIHAPFSNEKLLKSISKGKFNLIEEHELRTINNKKGIVEFCGMVGVCNEMLQIFKKVQKIAQSNSNILILGESGTGKELLAQAIHKNSNRSDNELIPVACNALPSTLMESELFGYEKGAFTGANTSKIGLIELAHKGTLFLDEVTEIDLEIQPKLLRFLQDRKIRKLAGLKEIEINSRIISASNKDPAIMIEEGKLREDLYYRLDVIRFELPPLRQRKDDIPFLINYFIDKTNKQLEDKVNGISELAVEIMMNYDWPGNVRQLENVIESAVMTSDSQVIQVENLPEFITKSRYQNNRENISIGKFKISKKKYIEQFEKDYIVQLLKMYKGNISQAAREAGINRVTIYRIIAEHNLSI